MASVFAQSIKEVTNAKLIAISSKSNKNLETFGDKFKINQKYSIHNHKKLSRIFKINCLKLGI